MKRLSSLWSAKETGVFLTLSLAVLVFSCLSDHFLSAQTLSSIATTSTEVGIIALGCTLLMIAGEFDLSVGSTFALCGMVFALLTETYEISSALAFFLSLLLGGLIGFINGLITLKTHIPSFITTLGTMLMLRGLVLIVTDGFPIAPLQPNGVMTFFSGNLGASFQYSLLVWLFLSVVFSYLLHFHPFGNLVMATGGNEEAAYAMGISIKRVKLICFVLTGLLSSLSGVIQYSHLMSLSPTAGEQYELRAIAIAVIGGTLLKGGSGTMLGTVLGTLILGVLASGLVQAGASTYWFRALVGLILVLAVIMNTNLQRLREQKG